ncbi:DUF2169 domain-containing protein [Sorangium sp. So ce590]|uniref:DUF2169 family type VI secretion system accessory protein n=1 Tax=Sorangium sp. So ce590 TaxID=3133317 RepID=UPI003F611FE0
MLDLPVRRRETVPVVTDGSIAAAVRPWQLQPPQDALVVVVKSSMTIVPEGLAEPLPPSEQEPPTGDVYFDEDPQGTLRYASDHAPFKPSADILMVGHAYAQPQRSGVTNVQLAFGQALRLSLAAIGDRRWQTSGPSAPSPFDRIPLRYERAFGGPGHRENPVGRGLVQGVAGPWLPNLERGDKLLRGELDRPAPACFAPVPATWALRASRLGTYDSTWLKERWPYFPRDFDWRYFNAAPPEQQIAYPRGDEDFYLAGVHPRRSVINGKLPGLAPRAFAQQSREAGGKLREIPLNLDTVWFDADALKVCLVWRGILNVTREDAPEIALLYACMDDVRAKTAIDTIQQRFFARIEGEEAPRVSTAPGPSAPPPVGSAEDGFLAGPVEPPPGMPREEAAALVASGAVLSGVSFFHCDLTDMDFRGKDLTGARFSGARLEGALFDSADLSGADLDRVSAARASFKGANLTGANLSGANLTNAIFSGARLADATLADASASGAAFDGADLARANLADATLIGVVFDGASAAGATFSGAALRLATFRRAVLDDAQMYDCSAEEASFDDASMVRFRADDAKLSKGSFQRVRAPGCSFQAAELRSANFMEADLSAGIFSHSVLDHAVLHRVTAKGARFRHARIFRAHAVKANFMEADFESADLSYADLRGANLYSAETLKATLDQTRLDQALLAGSKLASS